MGITTVMIVVGEKRWEDQYLKGVEHLAHPWDLHDALEENGGKIIVATDGGTTKTQGYYGWVVDVVTYIQARDKWAISAQCYQLNSLRPGS